MLSSSEAANAHLNSSSEGRLSDQAMGVCTAVISSWPKSMMTSRHSSLPSPGFFRMLCHRLHTCNVVQMLRWRPACSASNP